MAPMNPYEKITSGDSKPKKELHKMEITKSHNGKHIVTHKHHHPETHPDETHVMGNMEDLHNHMEDHLGGGDAPAPDAAAPAAPMTAAPSPMPAPAAGAGPAGM